MHRRSAEVKQHPGVFSLLMLSFWLFKQNKRTLLALGFSLSATILFITTACLYKNVTSTAALQRVLRASPSNAQITVLAQTTHANVDVIQRAGDEISSEMSIAGLEKYTGKRTFQISINPLPVMNMTKRGITGSFELDGYDIQQATTHVQLLQGRLPAIQGSSIEVALSDDCASALNVKVGTNLLTAIVISGVNTNHTQAVYTVPLKVVGIFHSFSSTDPYWKGMTFLPQEIYPNVTYPLLASQATIFTTINTYIKTTHSASSTDPPHFPQSINLNWQYTFTIPAITNNDLDPIVSKVLLFQLNGLDTAKLSNTFSVDNPKVIVPGTVFRQFVGQGQLSQVMGDSFIVLTVLLLFYFISILAHILIERHATDIARLRSRGASRGQIFLAQALQVVLLGVLCLLIGTFLAIPLAYLLAKVSLSTSDQSAITAIFRDIPFQLQQIIGYLGAVIVIALIVVLIAIYQCSQYTILTVRQEEGRASRQPFWLHFKLDILGAIVVLLAAVGSTYFPPLASTGSATSQLYLTPWLLIRSLLLVIAALFLCLRAFPWLIDRSMHLFAKRRSATLLLALMNLTRAPRQMLRLVLLLTFALAFTLFSCVLYASQTQRANDIATQLTGSDIHVTLDSQSFDSSQMQSQIGMYRHIKGVTNASFGYTHSGLTLDNDPMVTIPLVAVDPNTFADTLVKPSNYSHVMIDTLLQQLVQKRSSSIKTQTMAALVDSTLWKQLHLKPGSPITLSDGGNSFHCIALAELPQIPASSQTGGILVDLNTLSVFNHSVFRQNDGSVRYSGSLNAIQTPIIQANQLWLRTDGTAQAEQAVTQTLTASDLSILKIDRLRIQQEQARQNPFDVQIINLLLLGALIVLVLALIGNFLVSWLTIQRRLEGFVVLQAIGAEKRQIAAILMLENGLISLLSLLLGSAAGAFLSATMVPHLVFTSAIDTSDDALQNFLTLQTILPSQLVIPPFLIAALPVFIIVCVLVIGMMIYIATRPALEHVLRLNVD